MVTCFSQVTKNFEFRLPARTGNQIWRNVNPENREMVSFHIRYRGKLTLVWAEKYKEHSRIYTSIVHIYGILIYLSADDACRRRQWPTAIANGVVGTGDHTQKIKNKNKLSTRLDCFDVE